jgi:hypothetical protein
MRKSLQNLREFGQVFVELFVEMLKEKTWIRLYVLALVFIGLALLLWSHGHYFEARLGITLTLVEIPIIVFGAVVANLILNESRKHAQEIGEEVGKQLKKVQGMDTTKKENHTKELNEKIFKRLATISVRESSRHGDYGLYVKKDNAQDDPRYTSIIYTKTDRTVIPLDRLPSTYYAWALRHLEDEEYSDKILKRFFELMDLVTQYNEERRLYRQSIEEMIDVEISKSFDDFSSFPKTIRERLEVETLTKYADERFRDLIIDRISNNYGIIPRGYPMEPPYVISNSITDIQLEKFKAILNTIMESKEFQSANQTLDILLFKRIDPLFSELAIKFHLLSDELGASGAIIRGKCKWEETNLSSDTH